MIRGKFKVIEKAELCTWFNCGDIPHRIKLAPVMGEPFGNATPSGNIEMVIVNNDAAKQFKVGKEYFVDFTPVE